MGVARGGICVRLCKLWPWQKSLVTFRNEVVLAGDEKTGRTSVANRNERMGAECEVTYHGCGDFRQ